MSHLNAEHRLYIDGALVDAQDGQTYDVVNPTTEEIAGVVAAASVADGDRALAAARRCFEESDWSTNRARRMRALTQFRDGLKAVADDWRRQIVAESGCPVAFTYGPLLDSSVADIDYSLELLATYEFEREIEDLGSPMGGPARRVVRKEAAGVVVAITPWNAPVQTNLQKIIPALAAGCTVVLKAAHDTPWSATMLGRVASQCPDFPPGALNVLTSTATGSLGAMLTADPRVDVISFTGSTATGRRVMESASKTIKRTLLELGGKSAMIVLDDADFSQALLGAANVCANAGQGCVLNTRLLVPRSRYDEAVAILEAVYRNVPYGDPNDANNIMGPMNVNGAFFFSANAPFGGYKQSGIGRENGVEGFEEYLETKTLAVPMDFPATSALAQPA